MNKLAANIKAIPQAQPYSLSTTISTPALPERAGALPERLQNIARNYLGARRQSGVSLLEAARWLSEARAEAKHGEWAIFLEAIGLDESRARAQIRIHEEAQRDPVFADRIVNGFLSETVARELLPAPPEVREELLSRETPPTAQEVREAKRALTPVLDELLIVHDQALLAQAAAINMAGHYSETGRIKIFHYADRRWVCMGTVHKGEAALSAEGIEVVTIADYKGTPRPWKKHGRNEAGTIAIYNGERLILTDRRIRVLPALAAASPEVASGSAPLDDIPPPDLSPYGHSARWLPDGRLAIRAPGNLESQHTAGQLNDLLSFWRSYPPMPADLAAAGVAWCYRSDRMYQVAYSGTPHHTGYTAAECLETARDYLERTGQAAAETDDSAIIAEIRAKAGTLGLGVIWEDDTVILHWPDEDIEQLLGMGYSDALNWLESEGASQAEARATAQPQSAPNDHARSDREAYEAAEEADQILIGKAERAISGGDTDLARDLLDQVQVATYRRDQVLAAITAQADQVRITLGFEKADCAALMKEAKLFERIEGLTKRLPTISQALLLLIEGIKATEQRGG